MGKFEAAKKRGELDSSFRFAPFGMTPPTPLLQFDRNPVVKVQNLCPENIIVFGLNFLRLALY